ncbi:MAG: 2-hydroxymuconate tautomerase family protein [Dehalococcoidales bacterium]|nr:2-hydroxymuconate tautomerase family protein [Dehalococcoidales bacterium]
MMPFITVDMYEGRTIEQKRQLVKDLTEATMKLGVPASHVQILIRDIPKHNWANAGKLASET